MSYRNKFYSKYVSTQTFHLYGEINLDAIKKQFPIWQKYFGRFLLEDKNAKIIDLGCGNGGFLYWLQELGYQNAEGIDISKEQIESAKKLGIKNIFQNNIKEFLSNLAANGSITEYDVIFMRDILEHFNKDEILDVLELVSQCLKSNGTLIIQTPNAESPFGARYRYYDFTHEISFTDCSIRQLLLVSGFKSVDVYPQRPVVHGLKSLIRFILWKFIEFGLRFYLLIETGSAQGIFTQNLIAVASKKNEI